MKKTLKKLFAVLLTLSLCLGISTSAFATSMQDSVFDEFDLPDDAVVLYQSPEIVLYQSVSESSTRKDSDSGVDYESVWLDKGEVGKFTIYNTHSGKVGITIGVEAASDASWAQVHIITPSGNTIYMNHAMPIRASDGEILAKMPSASTGTYTVRYTASTSEGMRIMCWMYNY